MYCIFSTLPLDVENAVIHTMNLKVSAFVKWDVTLNLKVAAFCKMGSYVEFEGGVFCRRGCRV